MAGSPVALIANVLSPVNTQQDSNIDLGQYRGPLMVTIAATAVTNFTVSFFDADTGDLLFTVAVNTYGTFCFTGDRDLPSIYMDVGGLVVGNIPSVVPQRVRVRASSAGPGIQTRTLISSMPR